MIGEGVGEATVFVRFDTTGSRSSLESSVNRELSGVTHTAERAGEQIGSSITAGTTRGLGRLESTLNNAGVPVTGLSRTFDKLKEHIESVNTGGSKWFQSMQTAGVAGIAAVGVGAVVAGVAMVKLASGMQSADASIANTAHISQGAAKAIGDAFLNTGGQTIFTGQQMAQAYAGVAAQLGTVNHHALNASQALMVMKASGDLAEGGQVSLSAATSVVSKTIQAFQLPLKSAASVSDLLYTAALKSGNSVTTLGTQIDRVRATMGAAAPPIKDMGGLILDLAEHGEQGRPAISALGSAFTGLISPSAQVTQAQKFLGLSFKDAAGNLLPLHTIIGELKPVIGNVSATVAEGRLKMLGFGGASAKLAETFQAGVPAFDKATQQVSKHGEAAAGAARQNQTLSHQFEILKTQVVDLATKYGEKLLPIVMKVGEFFVKLGLFLLNHKVILLGLAAAIFVMLIPAFIALTMTVVIFTAALLANPLTWIALLVAALVVGIVELSKHWGQVWGDIKNWTMDAWHVIDGIFHNIEHIALESVNWIRTHWQMLVAILTGPVGVAVYLIVSNFGRITGFVKKVLDDVAGFFKALPGRLLGALGDVVHFVFGPWLAAVSFIDSNVIEPIISWFRGLPGRLANAVAGAVTTIFDGWLSMGSWIDSNVIAPIVSFFEKMPGAIGRAISGAAGDVVGGATSIINAIIGAIDDGIDAINSHIPSIFGHKILPSIPDIPKVHLASGGVVTKPTIALIGEAGPEAVVPLGRNRSASTGAGGNTFNFYGVPMDDANSIARELSWSLKTASV